MDTQTTVRTTNLMEASIDPTRATLAKCFGQAKSSQASQRSTQMYCKRAWPSLMSTWETQERQSRGKLSSKGARYGTNTSVMMIPAALWCQRVQDHAGKGTMCRGITGELTRTVRELHRIWRRTPVRLACKSTSKCTIKWYRRLKTPRITVINFCWIQMIWTRPLMAAMSCPLRLWSLNGQRRFMTGPKREARTGTVIEDKTTLGLRISTKRSNKVKWKVDKNIVVMRKFKYRRNKNKNIENRRDWGSLPDKKVKKVNKVN